MTLSSGRRDRVMVRHVIPVSAGKMAFALGLAFGAIFLVGFAALYLLAAASGVLEAVESFIGSLGFPEFELRFFGVMPFITLAGLALSAIAAVVAMLLAALYNALADLLGGLEITSRDR